MSHYPQATTKRTNQPLQFLEAYERFADKREGVTRQCGGPRSVSRQHCHTCGERGGQRNQRHATPPNHRRLEGNRSEGQAESRRGAETHPTTIELLVAKYNTGENSQLASTFAGVAVWQ